MRATLEALGIRPTRLKQGRLAPRPRELEGRDTLRPRAHRRSRSGARVVVAMKAIAGTHPVEWHLLCSAPATLTW